MIKKNYRLIRFMNKDRSSLARKVLGATSATGTYISTGSNKLAVQSWRDFVDGEIKAGFRRCGWYARKGWMHVKIVDDPFFIFTEGLGDGELDALARFIEKKQAGSFSLESLSDFLFIDAQRIHVAIEQKKPKDEVENLINEFYRKCNNLLMLVDSSEVGKNASNELNGNAGREGDFSKSDAVVALEDFSRTLPIESWPWFVESGTFLGLHREGSFLDHDYDIDLGINYEECTLKELVSRFEISESFVVKKVDSHIEVNRDDSGGYQLSRKPSLVKLVHCTGINVDIFLHHLECGFSWHGSSIHWWKNRIFDLERRTLEGVEVNAPKQADQYLTENYGNWRTPITDFDCTSGTPNLTVARNFLSVALFLKRLAVFSLSSPEEAKKVRSALLSSGVIECREHGFVMREYL